MTPADAESAEGRKPRILIVDDEPFNVDYLEQELDALGFDTETAANGAEALEQVAADAPDLVLLDVMMPVMDGIAALRVLKRDPKTRLIPVVLMTALRAVEDRVRGIEAGADDFLSKPVDDRELLARIRTALATKRAIDATVGELERASEHLERYGSSDREVAILALRWRSDETSMPEAAVAFLSRASRQRAARHVREGGGVVSESSPAALLVAAFEGPDLASRVRPAAEAALAVLDAGPAAGEAPPEPAVSVAAAVCSGVAHVGSVRADGEDESRWVFAVEGEPVDRAVAVLREPTATGLVVSAHAAAALRGHHAVEREGEDVFRVLAAVPGVAPDVPDALTDRRIRTILVTDIVGSTSTVELLGDRAWAQLVADHEQAVRDALALYAGSEVDTAGDGFLASFDGPALAIHCALAAVENVAALGLSIRAGIHTGEVEERDGRLRGIAVHVTSRIASLAEGGEVLVSPTTRELVAGAGLAFVDRGEHVLKGVSEPRRLYAVTTELATNQAQATPADGPPDATAEEV